VSSLLIIQGPLAGQRLEVEGELVLGRMGADVTIDDPLVSRRHLVIRRTRDGVLELEDLGSLNGTWVNRDRVAAARRLADGDVVALGGTAIVVQGDRADEREPPSTPPTSSASSGAARPGPHAALDDDVRDELRTVTALFADVVGSTGLGERLGAHEAKALIGECVTRMSRVVERFGGYVQAYMGDGIAAYFGHPITHEDDPERAARAGLALLSIVREYAREVESEWGIADFNVRVGINTGEAAVGLVGAAMPQAVAVGDTTNVAARLQAAADPGTVIVGESTAKALTHRFSVEPLGELAVKGRTRPVRAWRLVAVTAPNPSYFTSRLVGREREVDAFASVMDELDAGRGHIMLFLGEVGIGKSRLLAELHARAEGRATWLEGHCLSYGAEVLYGPFIQILHRWIGAVESEPNADVEAKLRTRLALAPPLAGVDFFPYLARALALGSEIERTSDVLPSGDLGHEIKQAYNLWVRSLTQRGPVIVALEDLHWLDVASAQLSEGLLRQTEQAPLLVVGTLRSDRDSEGRRLRELIRTQYASRSTELQLEPLSAESSRMLLDALPQSHGLDRSSLELIVASAEGNPLYLEELLNAFVEGHARRPGETWAPSATGGRLFTPTLQGLMLARLDRLPQRARALAQTAAVIGRRVPLGLLERVDSSVDIADDLAVLIEADVIHEARRYPETEYVFRHGLLREAILSTLPPPRRRELYGAVVVAFDEYFAGSADEHVELLAHYLVRSGDLARALDCLERAGDRAAGLDAPTHAAELWSRAMKVAERLGDASAVARLQALVDGLRVGGSDAAPDSA
jgi:class 3 adenylate cyclase